METSSNSASVVQTDSGSGSVQGEEMGVAPPVPVPPAAPQPVLPFVHDVIGTHNWGEGHHMNVDTEQPEQQPQAPAQQHEGWWNATLKECNGTKRSARNSCSPKVIEMSFKRGQLTSRSEPGNLFLTDSRGVKFILVDAEVFEGRPCHSAVGLVQLTSDRCWAPSHRFTF